MVTLNSDNIVEKMLSSQALWVDVCGVIAKLQIELSNMNAALWRKPQEIRSSDPSK